MNRIFRGMMVLMSRCFYAGQAAITMVSLSHKAPKSRGPARQVPNAHPLEGAGLRVRHSIKKN